MSVYTALACLAIAYYLVLYTINLVHLVLGYRAASRWKKIGYLEETHRLFRSEMVPPLSLVTDLEYTGEDAVQWVDHALSQRFPEMELIVFFRGEGGERVESLVESFFLRRVDKVYRSVLETPQPLEYYQSDDRRLLLVRTDAAARGEALNQALNLSRYPLFAVAGNGMRLEDDALLCLVRPFMEGEVRTPVLMGVELPLEMADENLLPPRRVTRFSLMESLRIQLGYMAGAPYLGGPVDAYGSLLVYRKRDLLDAGGFRGELHYMEAEMDAGLRLHRLMREEERPYRFVFLPHLVALRPFPQRWREQLSESRARGRGIYAMLKAGKDMALRPRYGIVGMLQIPIVWLFVHLAPFFELGAYAITVLFLVLGRIGWPFLAAFLACSMLYPALVGVGAVTAARRELGILRGQGVVLYGYAFLTQVWFRQLSRMAVPFGFLHGKEGRDEPHVRR